MKVIAQISDVRVEIDAQSVVEAFAALAAAQQGLSIEACPYCETDQYVVRWMRGGEYTFYGLRCNRCSAELQFTQSVESGKEGRLFPRRKNYGAEGKPEIGRRGWTYYKPNESAESKPAESTDELDPFEDEEDDYNPFEDESASLFEGESLPAPLRQYFSRVLPKESAREALVASADALRIDLKPLLEKAKAEGIEKEVDFRKFAREYIRQKRATSEYLQQRGTKR